MTLSWGIGVEHEMHVFLPGTKELREPPRVLGVFHPVHSSPLAKIKQMSTTEAASTYGLSAKESALLSSPSVDAKLEMSAKRCVGLLPPRANMVELLNPEYKNRTVVDVARELEAKERTLMSAVGKLAGLKAPAVTYPHGAAIMYDGVRLAKDYTGSWQFTITLPHPRDISVAEFVYMHERFANVLQWLEPLFAACMSSPDPSCVLEDGYAWSSYRTFRFGWGNYGGTNIRRLHMGVGRRANAPPLWREGLQLKNASDLAGPACPPETRPSKNMDSLSGKFGVVSSDFRTFGVENGVRKSGAPMRPGHGLEFRIFDQFPTACLRPMMQALVELAEVGLLREPRPTVQGDADWNAAVRAAVTRGWACALPRAYLKKLASVLGVESLEAGTPHDVLSRVLEVAHERAKGGPVSAAMMGAKVAGPARLPNCNLRAFTHFYYSFYNAVNRRAVAAALNAVPENEPFATGDLQGLSTYYTGILPHVLHVHAMRGDVAMMPGDRYVRLRRVPAPLTQVSGVARCSDRRTTCSLAARPL